MKSIIILLGFFVYTMAQRPTYAGSRPIGRPELASRFRDTEESTTVNLNNRIGEGGSTPKIPVDARGDSQLVDRLNQWPREHRPFWLLNADHIEASRNGANQQNLQSRFGEQETITIRPAEQRPTFLGSRN